MPQYYFSRFDESKKYQEQLYRAGYAVQSAEFNELQKTFRHQLKGVANSLLKDGDIIKDADVLLNNETAILTCNAGQIFVDGIVHSVDAKTIENFPLTGTVSIGVFLIETVVSELEDKTLRDPATGTTNFEEPGACRLKIELQWGYFGMPDSPADAAFYPIYWADDGILRAKEAPPTLDGVNQAIAVYDRDSAGGSYVVSGMTLRRGEDDASGNQIWFLDAGRCRVNGYGVTLATSRRLIYPATPDIRNVDLEVTLADGSTTQRCNTAFSPIAAISSLRVTKEKTETVTHGSYSGVSDPLSHTGVVKVLKVFDAARDYAVTTDYLLTGNNINWSPSGNEPSTGASYNVTYQYIENVEPENADETGFSVTGAVKDTQIMVTYDYKLPRIDRLCIDQEGALTWVQGVAADYSPLKPNVPNNMLSLASVYQYWNANTYVSSDGIKVVPMDEINGFNTRLNQIVNLLAIQGLEASASNIEAGQKKGLFVDPFLNDNYRDATEAANILAADQSHALISNGILQLPLTGGAQSLSADTDLPQYLDITPTTALSQSAISGFMRINPYDAFDQMPAEITLKPAIDRWTETQVVNEAGVTQTTGQTIWAEGWHTGYLTKKWTETSSYSELLDTTTEDIANLRQIDVQFAISGFGPGEILKSVTFDGIAVEPQTA